MAKFRMGVHVLNRLLVKELANSMTMGRVQGDELV
jgi:hypothetical protein